MYLQVPVIAVNSGGPKETVLSGQTGFLCEQVRPCYSLYLVVLVLTVFYFAESC